MKKLLLAALALVGPLIPACAQTSPVPTGIPGWYQLHTFGGEGGHWKLGLDAGLTAGACLEREIHDGQWLAGPCRDLLLLAKDSQVAFHLGVAAMSNSQHGNTAFQVRAGFNIGPTVRAGVATAVDRIPALEKLSGITLPPWAGKLADMTTIDFAGGPRPIHDDSVNGLWTYGVAMKVDVPLDVVFGWLDKGL